MPNSTAPTQAHFAIIFISTFLLLEKRPRRHQRERRGALAREESVPW
jgi:hypothetical protein